MTNTWSACLGQHHVPRHSMGNNIKRDFKEVGLHLTGLVYSGRILWTRSWAFAFHKMREISWPSEEPSACEEALCSMKLVVTNLYTATDCRLWFFTDRVGRSSVHETIGRQCMNGCVGCVPFWDMGFFVQADYPGDRDSELRSFVPYEPMYTASYPRRRKFFRNRH
jgi:hypothetical protein